MIIMTIMAMTEGTKYRSAADVGVAVGAVAADCAELGIEGCLSRRFIV